MKTNTQKKTTNSRVRKLSRRSRKKVVKTFKQLPSSFKILSHSLKHLWAHKRFFGIILIIYFALYMLLVKGLAANFQLVDTNEFIQEASGGEIGLIERSATLFGTLIGSAGTASTDVASIYQIILFVVLSLVIIWGLRTTFDSSDKAKTSIKKAFYTSMYPLIPYILVGMVIILQILPALISTTIYSLVKSNGIAVSAIEQIFWLFILLLGIAVSAYMLSSSLFSSYIVTLPNTTPMVALRSARKLVKFRRWQVIRKLLFLPLIVFIFLALIFLPLVIIAPVIAEITFAVFSLALIFFSHTYLYVLYRELL